jgi:hypothetical protein
MYSNTNLTTWKDKFTKIIQIFVFKRLDPVRFRIRIDQKVPDPTPYRPNPQQCLKGLLVPFDSEVRLVAKPVFFA